MKPSLRSKLLLFLMKNRHLFRGKLHPQSFFDERTSLKEFRENVEKVPKHFGSVPENIEIEPVRIGDLYAEWLTPAGQSRTSVILYFHGGGYVSGTCRAHRMHVAKVVNASGVPALVFEYRVAPEHPFPAALNDAVTAYRHLLDQGIEPGHIGFMGDSAGGGLALATLHAIKAEKLPLPAAAVALSPWTDLACTGDSYVAKRDEEPLAPLDSWIVFSRHYVGDNDPQNPLISPLHGDLSGFPPLMLFVGEHEVFLDDTTRFAEKATASGVDVTCTIGKGLFHCYPVCAPLFPEATEAMKQIGDFFREHTASAHNSEHIYLSETPVAVSSQ